MLKQRLLFSKGGRARFLSHLDTIRILQRALTRAGAPVAYSQGFNPHMQLSILLPLPLGVEGVCELADLRFTEAVQEAALLEALSRTLPEGFAVHALISSDRPVAEIGWITYEMQIECMSGFSGLEDITALWDGRPMFIQKRTKRGETEFDVTPYIKEAVWELTDGHTITCTAKLSAQNPTVNPIHLLMALQAALPRQAPDMIWGKRLALWDAEHHPFIENI